MKCRGGAITAIRNSIWNVLDEGFVQDEQIASTIRDFLKHKFGARTTPQDIQLLNDTMDLVINHLCSAYQLEKPSIDYGALLKSARAEHGLMPGQLAPDPGYDE